MTNEPFTIEKIYSASISEVWKAISDRDEMAKWYFDIKEFKAEVGFEFEFEGGPSPDNQFTHLCKVTEAIPNKKLTYSWHYDGYEGNSFVTFELFEERNNTRLKLTHAGLESFPKNKTEFAKENFAIGWTHIVGTALKEFLEK